MKRLIVIAAALIALAAGGYYVYQQQMQPAAAQIQREGRVARETIENTVSASGNLSPEARYDLRFSSTGRISAVNVKPGDRVVTGQTLAVLDDSTVQLDLADARTQLAISQVKLAQLGAPAAESDLALARANVDAAKASLADLSKAADPDQLEIVRLGVERAKIQLWQAQLSQPPEVLSGVVPDYQFQLGRLRTDAGDLSIDQAEAQYRQAQRGATRDQLAAARAQIDQAQAQLDRMQAGPSEQDVALLQAQVDAAQLAVEAVQARVPDSQLAAPAPGVVAVVSVDAGEVASPVLPAVVLVDDHAFHLDVDVDEIDVAKLSVGQAVTVTLDALPDVSLRGTIDKIAPASTAASSTTGAAGAAAAAAGATTGGVVSYSVRVILAGGDARVRTGMTATALVVTERRVSVLVVPNWSIRIDKGTGEAYVPVERDGRVQEVAVTLGLRNENVSEVLSGVSEGERIVVTENRGFSLFGGQ